MLVFGEDTVNATAYWLVVGVWLLSLLAVVGLWLHRRSSGQQDADDADDREALATEIEQTYTEVGSVVRRRAREWVNEHGLPEDVADYEDWGWDVPGDRDQAYDKATFDEAWYGASPGRAAMYPLIQKATRYGAVTPEDGEVFRRADRVADLKDLNRRLARKVNPSLRSGNRRHDR